MTIGIFELNTKTMSVLRRSAVGCEIGNHTISHWQRIVVPQMRLPPRADQERSDRRRSLGYVLLLEI